MAQGAVESGIQRLEELLLAADDFSRRMLGLYLEGWIIEELGLKKGRLFTRSVKAAAARNPAA